MVNETLGNNLEYAKRPTTSSEQYPLEEYDKHYKEIREMNLISDGWKWIKRQEQIIKLNGNNFEFTADNVQKKIKEYLWKLKFDENMKQDIINSIDEANDRLDYPWIYQAAALLLFDSEKWNPYSSFPWKENSGLWVKALLGKRHFENFIEEKKNCIKEQEIASNKWERRSLEDILASCELDYIYHNVLWANSDFRFFGNREGSHNQDGITNPSNLILSENFADRLWTYKQLLIKSHTEHLK